MFRTRCAPSPTGFLHIGGLKTFLFAYLMAKKNNGKFILRIEDTDRTRFVEGAMEAILRGFQWAGLELDEGPMFAEPGSEKIIQHGEFGPYIQSERFDLYRKYAEELVGKGRAYYCFCSAERLTQMRADQERQKIAPKYDRTCLRLSVAEVEQQLAAGEKHVIRLKAPENETIIIDDQIKGKVRYNSNEIDDQVLLKSDGFPTYHLAVVVDDHLMQITHVIRADEWLPSTPKHILLYEAFGWELPVYAHVPPILAPGGKKKLSKREGSVSVDEFIAQGYLPEAMINYLALLGWNPGTTQEIFTMPELIEQFSLERCQKAGAVFDEKRLNWMNGQYIRKMTVGQLTVASLNFVKDQSWFAENDMYEKAIAEIQPRLEKLSDVPAMIEPFYQLPEYDPTLALSEKMGVTPEVLGKVNGKVIEKFSSLTDWTKENLQQALEQIITEGGFTKGQVYWPVRALLSGRQHSPGAFEMAYVLGKEETLRRLGQC